MLGRDDNILVELLGRDSPPVRALIAAANSGMNVSEMLRSMARQEGLNPDDPPRFILPYGISPSDFPLGSAMSGDVIGPAVGPAEVDLTSHLGIFGMTGTGKTTLLKLFLMSFAMTRTPIRGLERTFIVLDMHGEFRDIVMGYPPGELIWMTADEVGLNPFEVPRGENGERVMPPDKWLNNLRELLRELWLNEPSLNEGSRILWGMYQQSGVLNGGSDYPSISDFIEKLRGMDTPRNSDCARAREKLLDRFESLRAQLPGLDVHQSRDFSTLLRKSLIIDLSQTKDIALPVLFTLIVTLLREVFRSDDAPEIRRAFAIEEGHSVLGGQIDRRSADLKEGRSTAVLRDLRKTGTCGVVVSQLISDIASAVLGNLGSVISFRQGHHFCVRQAAATLNLTQLQEPELPRLPNRRAIARFSRYGDPIDLAIPDARDVGVGMLPRPSIAEARNRSKAALDAIPYVKRRAPPPPTPWVLDPAGPPRAQTQPSPGNGLLPEEMRLLVQVAERPWELIETRMDSLGLDRETEGEIRSRLETKGLIESAGTVGARHKLFDLTGRGREVCHKGGITLPQGNTGKGKVAHQCIVEYTQRTLGMLSTRFRFQRSGVSFSTRGVQPDVLLLVRA